MWEGFAILVRHGVTWWDSQARGPRVEGQTQPSERVTGWLDLPLRHEGVEEVLKTSQELQPFPVDLIVTSPLQRAMMTADAVKKLHPSAPIRHDPSLSAWNTGIYSGQLTKDVQKDLDRHVTQPNLPVQMGETFGQFVSRYLPVYLHYLNAPQLIVIVTHGMNVAVSLKYQRTGNATFTHYGGVNAGIKPGEAVLVTPTGEKELVA